MERPEEAEWPDWAEHIRQAWLQLRDDRHLGDMGGIGRIYYSAIITYAAQHDIAGEALSDFVTYLRAIDDEYILWFIERRREQERNRTNGR